MRSAFKVSMLLPNVHRCKSSIANHAMMLQHFLNLNKFVVFVIYLRCHFDYSERLLARIFHGVECFLFKRSFLFTYLCWCILFDCSNVLFLITRFSYFLFVLLFIYLLSLNTFLIKLIVCVLGFVVVSQLLWATTGTVVLWSSLLFRIDYISVLFILSKFLWWKFFLKVLIDWWL